MRQRKYRAWDKRNKCWLENFNITDNGYVWEAFDDDTNYYSEEEVVLVDWIGLLDEGGEEIYEENIVFDIERQTFFLVYWDDDSASFRLSSKDGRNLEIEANHGMASNLQIRGNSFENPELLESRK